MTKNISEEQFMTFMNNFKETIEKTVDTLGDKINLKIERQLGNIDKDLKDLKEQVKTSDDKQDKINKRMEENIKEQNRRLEDRMKNLEQAEMRKNYKGMKSDTLGRPNQDKVQPTGRTGAFNQPQGQSTQKVRMQEDRTFQKERQSENREQNEQPERRNDPFHQPMIRSNSWAEEVEQEYQKSSNSHVRNEGLEDQDRRQWTEQRRGDWTDGLRAEVCPTNGRHDEFIQGRTKDDSRLRNKKTKISKATRDAIRTWFGDEDDSSESTDSEEESPDENEDRSQYSTVDRRRCNRERRKKVAAKKAAKVELTALKARNMVGLSPITTEEIEAQKDMVNDYNIAKILAVKEHLREYYKYNQEELDELNIIETKTTNKKDNCIYIAVEDHEHIRDIYHRKAECKRNEVSLRNYVPPQFFERFSTLNRICKEKRSRDGNLKTQIRFGLKDLELLTKTKGSDEPFRNVDLDDFIGLANLPGFDHSIKWTKREERSRRVVTSSRESSPAGPVRRKLHPEEPAGDHRQKLDNTDRGVTRMRSKTDKEKEEYKKPRQEDTGSDIEMEADPLSIQTEGNTTQ